MDDETVVEHCPNCGAPLHLDDQGDCHWCHERVRVTAPPSESSGSLSELPDPDGAIAKMVGHEQLRLPDASGFLPLLVYPLLAAVNTFGFDPAVQRFLTMPARLSAVQLVTNTVKAAGERLQDADVSERDVLAHGNRLYTPDEWWSIDLLVDLGTLQGVDRDTRSSARDTVRLYDDLWRRKAKRPIRHAGEGPRALHDLRATVPHRDA